MEGWAETAAALSGIHDSQLFFIGGVPRSGTTWLQQMLDTHPDASCQGEGLFAKVLYPLLDDYLDHWKKALADKNRTVFAHLPGYPLPGEEERHFLAASMILLALRRQAGGRPHRAYGEKTPENIFFWPQLRTLFPNARFIAIARDPRDVLTSIWHYFYKSRTEQDDEVAKRIFVEDVLPAMVESTRQTLTYAEATPDQFRIVTYEALRAAPDAALGGLFAFLGLSHDRSVVAQCVEQTRFETATGGRAAGEAANGTFLRKGLVGDWPSTINPELNAKILQALGWAFPAFGWIP